MLIAMREPNTSNPGIAAATQQRPWTTSEYSTA